LSSEKIDEALKHARKEKTQDGYNAALNRFTVGVHSSMMSMTL